MLYFTREYKIKGGKTFKAGAKWPWREKLGRATRLVGQGVLSTEKPVSEKPKAKKTLEDK